jgi:allophanate hydrolase
MMSADPRMLVAVVGAHLTGQPLNHQLTERAATFIRQVRTAPDYLLYALTGTVPAKPGLRRVAPGAGFSIEVEVWSMPEIQFGSFLKLVGPPLGIGTLMLEDGTQVKGFICEPIGLDTALDISTYGGWRAYLQSKT